jgi:uncharacterized cupin superfamily protein
MLATPPENGLLARLRAVGRGEPRPLVRPEQASSADGQLQLSHVFHQDLAPADLPAEWVIAGAPKARVKRIAQAPDGAVSAALWECSAGTFRWFFASDELVHVLAGQVKVRCAEQPERVLRSGDVAYFSAGTCAIWEIDSFVRKLAVIRANREPLRTRLKRRLARLLGR